MNYKKIIDYLIYLYPSSFRKEMGTEWKLVTLDMIEEQKNDNKSKFSIFYSFFIDSIKSLFISHTTQIFTIEENNGVYKANYNGFIGFFLYLNYRLFILLKNISKSLQQEDLKRALSFYLWGFFACCFFLFNKYSQSVSQNLESYYLNDYILILNFFFITITILFFVSKKIIFNNIHKKIEILKTLFSDFCFSTLGFLIAYLLIFFFVIQLNIRTEQFNTLQQYSKISQLLFDPVEGRGYKDKKDFLSNSDPESINLISVLNNDEWFEGENSKLKPEYKEKYCSMMKGIVFFNMTETTNEILKDIMFSSNIMHLLILNNCFTKKEFIYFSENINNKLTNKNNYFFYWFSNLPLFSFNTDVYTGYIKGIIDKHWLCKTMLDTEKNTPEELIKSQKFCQTFNTPVKKHKNNSWEQKLLLTTKSSQDKFYYHWSVSDNLVNNRNIDNIIEEIKINAKKEGVKIKEQLFEGEN